ncbi:MAG: EAL domain-containing protein [Gammaproteobacteria bacterium]|nr:EAL domain-containing protein [Gammaproteobacteria bacterium]
MRLLPKLSLFTIFLVTATAVMSILISINTIKGIIYDLNSQLIQNDLENMQQRIEQEYDALQQHGLQNVKGYYEKVLTQIKGDFTLAYENEKGTLILLDKEADILLSDKAAHNIDYELLRQKHLSAINHSSEKKVAVQKNKKIEFISSNDSININGSKWVYFYKRVPQWDLGLFVVLKHNELFSRLNDYIDVVTKGFVIVLCIALVIGFLFSNYLVSRIKSTLLQIQAIKHGDMRVRLENITGNDEITELKYGLNDMSEMISQKIFKQAEAELNAIQSKQEMQEKHALLNGFISAMPELALILDEEGEYIEIYGNNNQLLYKPKERLIGTKLTESLPEDVSGKIMETIGQTLKQCEPKTINYELDINGEKKYFQGHTAVFEYAQKNKTGKGMVVFIIHDMTEQVLAKQEAYHLSLFDPLTGLPNRRLLMERLDQEISRCKRHNDLGALLFIDLDDFKTINDTRGHRTGDLLLKEVAKRLTFLNRKEDLVSRLGGDEFVILLSDLGDNIVLASSQAQTIAYKTLEVLQDNYELENERHQISCSIGVVMFPEKGRDSHDLIKYADIAMYQAKDEGKNTVRLFAPHMQILLENRLQLQNDLRVAIKENKLTIHLQPQYDEKSTIISAEALVRWNHPEKGFISPAEFIPIAEESGLVHALGKSVMELVLCHLKDILKLNIPDTFKSIAINVSPWQFGRKDYLDEVKGLLEKHQVQARYIELEITEQTLVGNFSSFSEKMKKMQDMGIHFSIDDFGTGYSSLSYLKSLPVNMLKIDQTFIRDVTKDKNDDAIVETIIVMARHLGLEVIAEGVETKEQLDFLLAHDCRFFQGYYFSKPIPMDAFIKLLSDSLIDKSDY